MAVGLQTEINVTGAISAGLSWPFVWTADRGCRAVARSLVSRHLRLRYRPRAVASPSAFTPTSAAFPPSAVAGLFGASDECPRWPDRGFSAIFDFDVVLALSHSQTRWKGEPWSDTAPWHQTVPPIDGGRGREHPQELASVRWHEWAAKRHS